MQLIALKMYNMDKCHTAGYEKRRILITTFRLDYRCNCTVFSPLLQPLCLEQPLLYYSSREKNMFNLYS